MRVRFALGAPPAGQPWRAGPPALGAARPRDDARGMTRTTAQDGGTHAAAGSPDLAGLLHRWTAQGLLTRDQADRILRAERLAVPQPRDGGDAGPPPVSQRR